MWQLLHKNNKSPFRIIIFGFLLVILMGSFLLMLPVSTKAGECTSFLDALFTATSAVCVTGLVIHDTATYWSNFGQSVIILLIQIGGLGVITVAGAFSILSGRKIGLMQRSTMQEAIAAPNVGGIVRRTGFILKTALAVELFGAVLLFPVFFREFGLLKGAWYSLFHSISAFCNAGFDLMGIKAPFSSLTDYADNPVISIVIALLIAIGGIGFLTWEDIRTNGLHFHKYRMQSKVILTVTGALILIPTIYFFLFEFNQAPMGERVLLSFFQAVTPRTAGFNTADLTLLSETGQFVIIILMLIGGSPGSTAGGMKTTTLAVLLANTLAVFRRREHPGFFNRRVSSEVVSQASTILIMYLVLFLTAGLVISRVEDLPVLACLFETASAIGTVGLSLGITPQLSCISHLLLITLMFFGRVGGLTLIFAALSHVQGNSARLPQERITVG
ncbi:Trk family potassium uptake protein [Pseudoflavonifractor sp. AF19-9AC]|uniref:TrkH family potassium uptake protein n=1 Tax=Pseudoflavonifractor sp. AF19-9AC TaxID=2292244 RepID=UPI000E4BDF9C|nr:potassium transporter TrkG [Pseudoflavonifractor sp. AF19-9AC]RHR04847.1 Trk family potassium uptake protein [Pseudoflavonifractor sp. AF19-9AC]